MLGGYQDTLEGLSDISLVMSGGNWCLTELQSPVSQALEPEEITSHPALGHRQPTFLQPLKPLPSPSTKEQQSPQAHRLLEILETFVTQKTANMGANSLTVETTSHRDQC